MAEKCRVVHGDIMASHASRIRSPRLRDRFFAVAARRTSLRPIEDFKIPEKGGFVTLGQQRTVIVYSPVTGRKRIAGASILLPKQVIDELYSARTAAGKGRRARVSNKTIGLVAHEGTHLQRRISGAPEVESAHLKRTYAVDSKQMMRDLRIIFGDELAKRYAKHWPTGIIAEAIEKVAEERAADEAAIRAVVRKRIGETGKALSRGELATIKEEVMAGRPWPIRMAVEADARFAAARRRGVKFKLRKPGALEELSSRLEEFAAETVSGFGRAEGMTHPTSTLTGRREGFSPRSGIRGAA